METQKNKYNKPIIIVGCQRSGTTLLRLILNAHSCIAIPEDASFLMPVIKKEYLYNKISGKSLINLVNYLEASTQFKLWNYDYTGFISELIRIKEISLKDFLVMMYSSYCESFGKTVWGDKTPSFFRKIDIVHSLFPDARFIHIVRDGRDVFDSWRKMTPAMRYVAVTALDWSYKLYKIEKSLKKIHGEKKITVRYEDLLERPEKTVKTICSVIGEEYEPAMLNFYQSSDYFIGKHHSELIFKPLEKSNCYKWRKKLNTKEIAIFTFIAQHFLKKYQYDTTGYKFGFESFMLIIKSIVIGLPVRLYNILYYKKVYEKSLKYGNSVNVFSVGVKPANAAQPESQDKKLIK